MVREPNFVHIGTSGWHYKHWKGSFYPKDLSEGDFLGYYAQCFHTAEINNTFYQLPEKEAVDQWRDMAPKDFICSVKASRYITHMKKLKDPEQSLSNFMDRIERLGDKLGPILFQLPPRWRVNLERLESFLKVLPEGHRYAFEFRDPSWFDEKVSEALKSKGAAFCVYDLEGRQSPQLLTGDFVYIRLHGPDGAYQGRYDEKTLSDWAESFSDWAGQNKEVYCYFDNDEKGYAVQNALALQEQVGEK